MFHRLLILVGLLSLLAACGTGNPAYIATAGGAGPYDWGDRFLDAQGFPLPGWDYVRDGVGGGSGGM